MKTPTVVYLDKVYHYDKTFHVCQVYMLRLNIDEVHKFLTEVGDEFYIIDGEIYMDDSAVFNLTMKYCDSINIVTS